MSRRTFGKKTLLFSFLATAFFPSNATAFLEKFKKDPFLNRDDIDAAIKAYYMTYDSTTPYPHKFNETITKSQLRTLQFSVMNGLEKAYVDHYLETMAPVFARVKALAQEEGAEKVLENMFEKTSSSYHLFERIDIRQGKRVMPCPYKQMLAYCKQYLGEDNFTIQWSDVCAKWCVPAWTGAAEKMGVAIEVTPGETCRVALSDKPDDIRG